MPNFLVGKKNKYTYKNWFTEGKVTSVKDQANCTACNAFAVVAIG